MAELNIAVAAIGIDLGTTNSLISVWQEGQARLIPNALNEFLTPSVVSLDEDGSMLIGRPALSRLTTHPQRSAALFKRFIKRHGTKHADIIGIWELA